MTAILQFLLDLSRQKSKQLLPTRNRCQQRDPIFFFQFGLQAFEFSNIFIVDKDIDVASQFAS